MEIVTLQVEYKDHDKVVLTSSKGNTYTSKSEELMDFLNDAGAQWEADMDKWISVDDRLPEVGVEVIVYRPNSIKLGDKKVTIDYLVKSQRYDPDEVLHSWSRLWNVTHWQPLPPVPKTQ